MTTFITTAKLSGAAGLIAVGSAVIGENVLTPDTHVPLSVLVTIVGIGVTSAFTISRVLTRWEDRLNAFEKQLSALDCVQTKCPTKSKGDTGHIVKPKK